MTLRFVFTAQPVEMTADEDEPTLVPIEHRELLRWSAAIDLRLMADEEAPQQWLFERNELRLDYGKHVSMGRPFDNTPTISGPYADGRVGWFF